MASLIFGTYREQGSYHTFGWEKHSDREAKIQSQWKQLDETENVEINYNTIEGYRWTVYQTYGHSTDPKIVEQIQILKGRILSAEYRQSKSAGADKKDPELLRKLEIEAIKWIQNQPLIKDKNVKIELAKKQLEELCTYNSYARFILESDREKESFFNYSIREGNRVAPFIQFRGTVQKIIDANLSKRIGAFGGNDLQISCKDKQKILTLPFEGKQISLFDEEVIFKGNYIVKINEVFQVFKDRNINIGNFEYLPKLGICNWNPKELGWYNPQTHSYERIDLTLEKWWEQLVPMEIITKEEASQRYEDMDGHKLACDGVNWIGTIITTSDSLVPDAEGNHGYLQMAIPDLHGNYLIYDFGKFTSWFPKTNSEKLQFVATPIKAVICYPDENRFNFNRDREGVSFLLKQEAGMQTMRSIQKDILKVRDGNLYFQIFIDSCLKWTFKKLKIEKQQMLQMCGIRLIDGKPRGFVGKVWRVLKTLPEVMQRALFYIFFTVIGGNRKFLVKKNDRFKDHSIMVSPPWAKDVLCPHPTVMLLRKRGLQV